jgi:diguanylate cyclase (GGDEF)-like protein/PAS domain S-box-containing protein
LLAEHAPVVLGLVDAEERLVDIGGALLLRQGWLRRIGHRISDIIDDEAIIALVRDGLRGKAGVDTIAVNGRPWLFAVRPVRQGARLTHAAVMLTYADVGTVHRELTARDATNRQLAALAELSRSFTTLADLNGRVTYLNRAGRELVGLHADEEVLGRPMADFFTEESLARVEEFNQSLRHRGTWQGESLLRHFHTGEEIPVSVDAYLVTSPTEYGPLGVATVLRDLRPQQRVEREMALRIQEQRAIAELGRLALSLSPAELAGEAVRLLHGRYPDLTATVLTTHRHDHLEIAACSQPRWVATTVPIDDRTPSRRAIAGGQTVRTEDVEHDAEYAGPSAFPYPRRSVLFSPIPGSELAWGVVGVSGADPRRWTDDDQTFVESVAATLGAAVRREQLESRLQHQGLHDPLTGLPNRALAVDRISHALERSARRESLLAVVLLDLDDFKSVNDVLGHAYGDELLAEVARRLRGAASEDDTVARLGGDEFVVVCEDVRTDEDVAFQAEALLEACALSYELDGHRVSVTASAGVAVSASDDTDATSLLSEADIAMYRAKRDRPGSYRVFDEAMRGDVLGRVNVAGELRSAVRANRIDVVFQPIVNLDDGQVMAMEALARWTNEQGEAVPPDVFIAVAEETGIIGELGSAVLRRAAREAVSWQAHGPIGLRVNASGHELRSRTYVDTVLGILAETGLSPHLLGLEITESMFVDEEKGTQDNLARLRDAGVSLLIDDFGTGYSSLSYLQRFPVVDVLKVDRTFLGEGTRGEAVVKAVTGLGEAFGMQVCAEGVETPRQHARVVELGCRLAQGYLLGRPQPPEQTRRVIAEWQPLNPDPAAI